MASAPPFRLLLPRALTPRQALSALRGLPGRVLLETASGQAGRSLLSAAPPVVVSWQADEPQVEGAEDARVPGRAELHHDPFAFLSLFAGDVPGGWLGYVGYEMGGALERLPPPPAGGPGLPDLRFGAHDWWVAWDGRGGAPVLEGHPLSGQQGDRRTRGLRDRMEEVRERLVAAEDNPWSDRDIPSAIPGGGGAEVPLPRDLHQLPPGVTSSLPHDAYREGVDRVRSHIRAGDLFQANLTQLLRCPFAGDGESLYQRLLQASPAPYAAFLDVGPGAIASISPESFLSLREGRVVTRPIKGTRPRDPDPERDGEARAALVESAKDRAENVMIVDLLRNDLSRVCRPGSVEVPRLLQVESHPTVHHLVSTVTGELRPGVGPAELLAATFPGGSITGAPKIRAMEILRELEPVPRGVYTGALGLVSFQGAMALSIAIRTAVLRDGTAWYGSGGGITLASDPEEEWRESVAKAGPFLRATGVGVRKEDPV